MSNLAADLVNSESSVGVLPADLSELTESIDLLNENMEVKEVVEGEEVIQELDVLNQILETLQPDEEQVILQGEMVASQADDLTAIAENLVLVHESMVLQAEQLDLTKTEMMDSIYEGSFFVGLAIVISFASYMFWNQVSKW